MQIFYLIVFCFSAVSETVSTETFVSVDREIAGMMDAWVNLRSSSGTGMDGFFMVATAILRAEAAYNDALLYDRSNLPEEMAGIWSNYLKAAADCIFSCRTSLQNKDDHGSEETITASFSRWETCGGEFLSSVQSTR